MVALLLAGARTQPVVLAFEDLHWADPTSLDLIEALAERGAQAPLLVVATTRPEFRAPWGMRSHHAVVALAPLDRTEVRRMVGEIAAQHALPQEVVERVSERTGGVPLFVEEVTRLLVERGEQGGIQAIPPTLQQSLAARLDRLGPARDVAQIGAVLGRDFAYQLLRGVAELDEPALQSSLERLAEADLLFVEGAPPVASYRFKHALIQDAAYDSLLKSRRQALHRRTAEVLRDSAERAAAEPEVIAHHFTQAGLDDLAIEWWGRAGDQALRRSAFQEAIAHLGRAIEMADKAGGADSPRTMGSAVATNQRLKLQTDYSQAVMWSKGFAAEETKAVFARAAELAATSDDFSARFATASGQWSMATVRGELSQARELASTFLREAEEAGRVREVGGANCGLAFTAYFLGDFVEAQIRCELTLEACGRVRTTETGERFGEDAGVAATSLLALTAWQLGEVDRARELINAAIQGAAELGHIPSMATPHYWKSYLEILRGDPEAALGANEALEAVAREHGMRHWCNMAELNAGWARGRLGDPTAGVAQIRRALTAHLDDGFRIGEGFYTGLLAGLEAETLGAQSAVGRIDEALDRLHQADYRYDLPFLHRIRAEILLKRDPDNPEPAEDAYLTAVAVANQQGARSHKLLASLALAKLYQSTGRPAEAHAVLAPALEGFAPTPEMPEIAEAEALLGALAETEEVKATETQRRQRLHLQTAYGNALFAARGYGAPETTEAFAKARESTSGDKDAPERLAADYGLWAGSLVRGELPSMRIHAAALLNDCEARPNSPEAGVAQRAAGITNWFAGEYLEARDHLERALAMFQPGRDDELAFRLGVDPGTAAMAYLAITSWPLGEVDRARSLIERMQTRMADLTHVGMLAYGKMHAALFEMMRGDPARSAPNAFHLVRLADEHNLPMFRAFGVFLHGWAEGQSGSFHAGLGDMRRGADLAREQGVLVFDGLFKIALAVAEARACDPGRGIAILDEALATHDRMGCRVFEAEQHRARGEILLKSDPANPSPRKKPSWPLSRSRSNKARAASVCARPLRSPSSINRPAALPLPTPYSRRRSKAFLRLPKCPRSPRRRRCSLRWWRPRRSKMRKRGTGSGCISTQPTARRRCIPRASLPKRPRLPSSVRSS